MTIDEAPRRDDAPSGGRRVTEREAIAAARTKVLIDKKRGRRTAPWIEELAARGRQSA